MNLPPSSDSPTRWLDYDQLVQEYEASLTTVLRGFRPTLEFSESWVPDGDIEESLLNLWEATQLGGRDEIALELSPESARNLNTDSLTRRASGMGALSVEPTPEGRLRLWMRGLLGAHASQIPPSYQKAVLEVSRNPTHLRRLNPGAIPVISGQSEGLNLEVRVTSEAQVTDLGFSGTEDLGEIAVLESLGRLVRSLPEGLPFREFFEHGLIRVEAQLRDTSLPPPVSGIVTPHNAGRLFSRPLKAMQEIARKSRELHNSMTPAFSTFDWPVSAPWAKLSREDKVKRLSEEIRRVGPYLGIPEGECTISELNQDLLGNEVRVFVQYPTSLPSGEKGRRLFRMEKEIARRLEAKIQVFLEEVKDRNDKRRLTPGG